MLRNWATTLVFSSFEPRGEGASGDDEIDMVDQALSLCLWSASTSFRASSCQLLVGALLRQHRLALAYAK